MRTAKAKGRQTDVADRIEFRLLVALSFAICLFAVTGKRIFGGASAGSESIFAEAKSAAFAAVGYAFHA